MGLMDKLLKTEQSLRKRIESAFGDGAAQTPLEIRREILEQTEAHIIVDKGGKSFPYGKVVVRLHPSTDAMRDVLQAAFMDADVFRDDIRAMLSDAGVRVSPHLQVEIEMSGQTTTPADSAFTLEFVRPQDVPKPGRPAAKLVVTKGVAEQQEYSVTKDRFLIGRLAELTDREGQMARRNDVVFLDNEDEINSTVGRAHATVFYDPQKREYRITDEVSRYGTKVFREGRSIDVPGGNPRGIKLKAGDEICLGRACLRFEIAE